MFEIIVKTEEEIKEGQGVRCEYCASGKLIVRKTDGAFLGMTETLPKEIIRSHFISFKRPLYGVAIHVNEGVATLHMVAPGRIKSEFTAVGESDIIPFPVRARKENEECAA